MTSIARRLVEIAMTDSCIMTRVELVQNPLRFTPLYQGSGKKPQFIRHGALSSPASLTLKLVRELFLATLCSVLTNYRRLQIIKLEGQARPKGPKDPRLKGPVWDLARDDSRHCISQSSLASETSPRYYPCANPNGEGIFADPLARWSRWMLISINIGPSAILVNSYSMQSSSALLAPKCWPGLGDETASRPSSTERVKCSGPDNGHRSWACSPPHSAECS